MKFSICFFLSLAIAAIAAPGGDPSAESGPTTFSSYCSGPLGNILCAGGCSAATGGSGVGACNDECVHNKVFLDTVESQCLFYSGRCACRLPGGQVIII
jgi:hypothetical protein